ncbi:MAG TPA: HD-GYP domain-containing protein [Solirubrobacteraceae bacterium]|nr:HD-GYP domain-containing protein [Solirubrobacteraceae bacterium]
MRRRNLLLVGVYSVLAAGSVAGAVLTSTAEDWRPIWLAGALFTLAMISDALALRIRTLRISGSFSALVLAMVLMGPAPAVAIAVAVICVDAVRSRPKPRKLLANFACYATFPLVGGLLARALEPAANEPAAFASMVMIVFFAMIFLNFSLIYVDYAGTTGASWVTGFRTVFLPVLPAECATALLTAALATIGKGTGPGTVAVLAAVILIVQYLLRFALEAMERGDQLEMRNRQLASLQVGLISTTLKTLALRDHMTARHSAAVARYSRAMAEALGLDEQQVDLIHTAALFHDVGKFIFPDSILLAETKLTDAEFAIVKRHPVVGADLIREIDGYGPVADIVRSHHERIDGRGYPDGLSAQEIPLGSRIIAVADVYDVITARDTYRKPVTISEAFSELRRSADSQLDRDLVELFIDLVETRGVRFRHSTAHDFEAELALERRVHDYAAPLPAAA